ncbi:MAG: low molecular weight phosphotyrosine protein phosphatase [Saccharofermentans sp.]|nr:low molecular weight phosphotyrosine protein phosphatase [Saccharofermentans sp.]
MIRVLMVCHGNICRSPVAEFILKDLADSEGLSDLIYCESRATHTDEIWNGYGSPVYPPMKKILSRHGISCEGKQATLISRTEYNRFDLIIGMDEENMSVLRRMFDGDPEGKVHLLTEYADKNKGLHIEDPWYTGNFEKVYGQIEEGCIGLMDYLKENRL